MSEVFGYSHDELLDFSVVARLQQVFSSLTGLVSHVVDINGHPLIDHKENGLHGGTNYCSKYIRNNELGDKMCRMCEYNTANESMRMNGPYVSYCHAGLVQFAYPVLVRGQMLCILTGGRAVTKRLTPKEIRENAELFGIPENELWEAAERIPVYSKEHMRLASEEMHMLAGVLSDMAETKLRNLETEASLKRSDSVKSDFLANMSHEIRTPMNAIIGMSELALREEMKDEVRGYLYQISSSGKSLLNIINDILDYSKIESGKMEIIEDEYEPLSLINDVASIIMNRIADKNIELMLNITPDIPRLLEGDSLRLKQILINIANNAVKFTNSGHIIIRAFKEITADPEVINLRLEVADTGIGIKKEDIGKLFGSFQQVDSKRNRNVEGTGLGLSIVKRLLELMGGSITVESEYNVGSTFSMIIPQKIVDPAPFMTMKEPEKKFVGVMTDYEMYNKGMVYSGSLINVPVIDFTQNDKISDVYERMESEGGNREKFLFIGDRIFTDRVNEIEEQRKKYPHITTVLMAGAMADIHQYDQYDGLKVLRKPVYALNVMSILQHQIIQFGTGNRESDLVDFEAPDAHILIVDDNSVNLTVSAGLLEPLHMDIDTATSGKKTLEMLNSKKYDIIFMDHMMPEMDGIETTRIIRRMYPAYSDTPIIALTANAVSGAKEMFLSEGMNDFVSKPIEMKTLIAKVKQWLPPEKVKGIVLSGVEEMTANNDGIPDLNTLEIADLQIKKAKTALGSDKIYWTVLKEYARQIESKADAIEKSYNAADWPSYIIEVHALKSSSRQIGAMELGSLAAQMEIAGNEQNIGMIQKNTSKLLSKYRSYIPIFAPYFVEEAETAGDYAAADAETTKDLIRKLRIAMDDLDMTTMEDIGKSFGKYSYDTLQTELLWALQEAISNVDVDKCEEVLTEWEDLL